MSADHSGGRRRTVLLLGGTSEIGLATVRALALAPGSTVFLCGRDHDALAAAAARVPDGVAVNLDSFDATIPDTVAAAVHRAFDAAEIDVVIPAFGVLGDQAEIEGSPAAATELLTVNVVAQTRALLESARRLRRQGHGVLVVLSSIAAVRPRRANFVYGASKAAVDSLARGLSDSLHDSGAHLLLVRPGFVVGRMTAGMRPAPLATTPEAVGRAIADNIDDPPSILWVPSTLRALALAMRVTPRPLWRRLRR